MLVPKTSALPIWLRHEGDPMSRSPKTKISIPPLTPKGKPSYQNRTMPGFGWSGG